MLTSNINFKNFKNSKIKKLKFKNQKWFNEIKFLKSLKLNYNYSYTKKQLNQIRKNKNFRLIGMGGSILGTEAIYDFLKHKIKKKFTFVDNLNPKIKFEEKKIKTTNIIVSKSGNTLETILNSNLLISRNKNIFITEKNSSYLRNLAMDLKAEIFEHKNYIGGRYSVLSEVGMLPAEIMGLNEKKFKRLNYLINNKRFTNQLITNVSAILNFVKKGKFNSVILNFDKSSENLFKWYQQLVAESLGKKSKGILPIISTMPKDNHSLMQFYLDGQKKSFYTFFSVLENQSSKINSKYLLQSHSYLKNKKLNKIINSQIIGTQNIFKKKKIPFRSFEILKKKK